MALKTISGISIVVPAYNEENYITRTLSSIQQAGEHFEAQQGLDYESIVVNNASTDRTGECARKCGARVIDHPIRNISSVRNKGIEEAKYELVVTIDADCHLPKEALVQIFERMQAGNCIGGSLGVKVAAQSYGMRVLIFLVQGLVSLVSGAYGGMFFFDRYEALEIGGFPEDQLIAEDSAFAKLLRKQAKKKGMSFARLKSVQVETLDRKDNGIKELAPAVIQAFRGFLGMKIKAEKLGYWYKPKR